MKGILFVLLALVSIAAYAFALDADDVSAFLSETGPVEGGTVVLYILAILALPVAWGWRGASDRWAVAAVLAFLAFRELDGDKRLFSVGLLKSRQYFGDAPLAERLIGIVVLAALAFAAATLLRRYLLPWLRALLRLRAWAFAVGLAGAFAVTSKAVDGAARKLAPYGIELNEPTNRALLIYEEVAELGIAALLLAPLVAHAWAAVTARRRERRERRTDAQNIPAPEGEAP